MTGLQSDLYLFKTALKRISKFSQKFSNYINVISSMWLSQGEVERMFRERENIQETRTIRVVLFGRIDIIIGLCHVELVNIDTFSELIIETIVVLFSLTESVFTSKFKV